MHAGYFDVAVKIVIYFATFILAHWPSNWLIRQIIKKRKPGKETVRDKMGAFIGTLERLLTIVLVAVGSIAAVGFIAAMKSIARYDKIQKEKAFAEYFLAGSMLSILIALLLALLAESVITVILIEVGA